LGRGFVGGLVVGENAQPVLALDIAQGFANAPVQVVDAGPAAVLAGEGGDDVDVVVAVVFPVKPSVLKF
jgi:hypothetical protein